MEARGRVALILGATAKHPQLIICHPPPSALQFSKQSGRNLNLATVSADISSSSHMTPAALLFFSRLLTAERVVKRQGQRSGGSGVRLANVSAQYCVSPAYPDQSWMVRHVADGGDIM